MEKIKFAVIKTHPTIEGVKVVNGAGPWDTKSGGKLSVLFQLPIAAVSDQYLHYDKTELGNIPEDIRGLRAYTVTDIPAGSIGANEWHKNRHELVFALSGKVEWSCEDIHGNTKSIELTENVGVWTPPYILHKYRALTDGSCLLVIANTLFMPNEPATHDSYSSDSFHEFQSEFRT